MSQAKEYISLYQFTKKIEMALEDPDLRSKWVAMEINSINVNSTSGHCYIEGIEKTPSGQTLASIKATIWKSNYAKLYYQFQNATGMVMNRGMKILALVSVRYHSQFGLSINITDIDPTFTLGENERQRRETIQHLHDDGIWDMNRMVPVADIISRLAVVSSPTAAGYGDFCHHIEESGYKVDITLFQSYMQGSQAEESVLNSLEQISRKADCFDAIVIIRGGGSPGDMDCFDSYRICSAIAQMPLPVITGIGHDRDTSIADMVAAFPLKTPTATAAWIIDRIAAFLTTMEKRCSEIESRAMNILMGMWNSLDNRVNMLVGRTRQILATEQLKISEYSNGLTRKASAATIEENGKITAMQSTLKTKVYTILSDATGRTGKMEQMLLLKWNRIYSQQSSDIEKKLQILSTQPKNILDRHCNHLDSTAKNLISSISIYREKVAARTAMLEQAIRSRATAIIRYETGRENNLRQLVLSHNPENVLKRGYAIVRKGKQIVPSVASLSKGESVEILFRDGTASSIIEEIKKQ